MGIYVDMSGLDFLGGVVGVRSCLGGGGAL